MIKYETAIKHITVYTNSTRTYTQHKHRVCIIQTSTSMKVTKIINSRLETFRPVMGTVSMWAGVFITIHMYYETCIIGSKFKGH